MISNVARTYLYERKYHALGLGSVRRDESDSMTLNRESAGDQFCFSMSMQMFPISEICRCRYYQLSNN